MTIVDYRGKGMTRVSRVDYRGKGMTKKARDKRRVDPRGLPKVQYDHRF